MISIYSDPFNANVASFTTVRLLIQPPAAVTLHVLYVTCSFLLIYRCKN